jgi:hypothetical protein
VLGIGLLSAHSKFGKRRVFNVLTASFGPTGTTAIGDTVPIPHVPLPSHAKRRLTVADW